MIPEECRAVKVGRHVGHQYGHRVTLSWNGGVIDLLNVIIVTHRPEVEPAVLFAHKGSLTFGNGVHVGYRP